MCERLLQRLPHAHCTNYRTAAHFFSERTGACGAIHAVRRQRRITRSRVTSSRVSEHAAPPPLAPCNGAVARADARTVAVRPAMRMLLVQRSGLASRSSLAPCGASIAGFRLSRRGAAARPDRRARTAPRSHAGRSAERRHPPKEHRRPTDSGRTTRRELTLRSADAHSTSIVNGASPISPPICGISRPSAPCTKVIGTPSGTRASTVSP